MVSPFFHEDEGLLNQQIPDYPKREIPQAPSTLPVNPWLASDYNPEQSDKTPLRVQVKELVRRIIVWGGSSLLFLGVAYFGYAVFSLYN